MGPSYAIVVVLALVGFALQGPGFRIGYTFATIPIRPSSKNRIRIPAKRPTTVNGRYPSGFG